MSREQLLQRFFCQVGHYNLLDIRTGRISNEQCRDMASTVAKLREGNIFIDDTASIRPLELRAKARRLQRDLEKTKGRRLDLVVVDYLQLMMPNGKHNNREQEIREISGSLKALAKELNVTVLALSQLKRSDTATPDLADLRESGTIEQDADIVAFVVRPELKDPTNVSLKGKAELTIRKHRNGPTGLVHLTFLSSCSSFVPSGTDYFS
jgi:replicative DNA helicase